MTCMTVDPRGLHAAVMDHVTVPQFQVENTQTEDDYLEDGIICVQ
jgi:hypothetical protein